GPKISFQVITKDGLAHKNLEKVCKRIVDDIIPWDQSACSSPQNLYLQEGIDLRSFLKALDLAFCEAPKRGQMSGDEAVEILKEKARAEYSQLMEKGEILLGDEHLIHFEQNKYLRPSPLYRSLIVKRFKDVDDLNYHLSPFRF